MADIFSSPAQAIVVPVNTGGDDGLDAKMGRGIAAQARRRYGDELYKPYLAACALGELVAGDEGIAQALTFVVKGKHIILAPTKDNWRDPSHLTWVRGGVQAIVKEVIADGINSVAIPALGCGEGGLDWNEVRPLIEAGARRLTEIGVKVEMYDPDGKSTTFLPTTLTNQEENTIPCGAITLPGGFYLVSTKPLPEGALNCGRDPSGRVAEPGLAGCFGSPIKFGPNAGNCPQCLKHHNTAAETLPCYEAWLRGRLNNDSTFRSAFIQAMSSHHLLGCPGCYDRELKAGHSGEGVICHTRIMALVFSQWCERVKAKRMAKVENIAPSAMAA